MAEIIDDTHAFSITAQSKEKARIDNVVAPETVIVGESFDVTYDVYNDGDIAGSIFGRLMNVTDPGNPVLITGSDWNEIIQPGAHKAVTFTFTDGITESIDVQIEAGHNE